MGYSSKMDSLMYVIFVIRSALDEKSFQVKGITHTKRKIDPYVVLYSYQHESLRLATKGCRVETIIKAF